MVPVGRGAVSLKSSNFTRDHIIVNFVGNVRYLISTHLIFYEETHSKIINRCPHTYGDTRHPVKRRRIMLRQTGSCLSVPLDFDYLVTVQAFLGMVYLVPQKISTYSVLPKVFASYI